MKADEYIPHETEDWLASSSGTEQDISYEVIGGWLPNPYDRSNSSGDTN